MKTLLNGRFGSFFSIMGLSKMVFKDLQETSGKVLFWWKKKGEVVDLLLVNCQLLLLVVV